MKTSSGHSLQGEHESWKLAQTNSMQIFPVFKLTDSLKDTIHRAFVRTLCVENDGKPN